MLHDREEAGAALAGRLQAYRGAKDTLVLGLPRGGVIVAAAIAKALSLPLDAFISKKLRSSAAPELAYGAVTEAGNGFVDAKLLARVDMKPWEHERELAFERKEVAWRKRLYRGSRDLPSVEGRRLILVDDGIATGATFIAALEGLRKLAPSRIVAAVPVGPADTLAAIEPLVDEFHVLERRADFVSVGACYETFAPVHDWEVVARLSAGHARRVHNLKA